MAAIVMYRGLMRDKRHWEGFQDHLQNKLSGRHQVYAFDTLGNGELNGTTNGPSINVGIPAPQIWLVALLSTPASMRVRIK